MSEQEQEEVELAQIVIPVDKSEAIELIRYLVEVFKFRPEDIFDYEDLRPGNLFQ